MGALIILHFDVTRVILLIYNLKFLYQPPT